MIGYIYFILNKVNGKTYIGQHVSSKLWNEDTYMGSGKRLKLAFKKYVKDNLRLYHWYTNGTTTVWAKQCPEGFTLGRNIK